MPKYGKRIYLSASSTVEATLVIPLFIYAVMTIMYVIQIVGFQIKVSEALYDNGRELAKYAYAYDAGHNDKAVGTALATGMVISDLGVDYIGKMHVIGGVAGISMLESRFLEKNEEIDLHIRYAIKNPFDIFGLGIMVFEQRAVTRAWVGIDVDDVAEYYKNRINEEENNENTVYVTPTGTVYHTSRQCTHLQFSISTITTEELESVRNQSGGKYYACEKCGKGAGESLYITDYGDRYHSNRNCVKLKRGIIAIDISEVLDRSLCSRCRGK